ncbi:MAG: subunit of E1(0) component of 2-oxoglutarate dehydrogenase [Sodalis sp. Fse]|nr:MAG: subunit of E1(0) component of 2-oxoglutarate dehydrogenase [Sodalis sp. Fse]
MQNSAMKVWLDSSYLAGENQSYIEQLYENFLMEPDSVDVSWNAIFKQLQPAGVDPDQLHSKTREYFRRLAMNATRHTSAVNDLDIDFKQFKVLQLINAFRFHGHLLANLDPLKLWKQETIPDLNPTFYNFTKADFQKNFSVGSFSIGRETMKLADLYGSLKKIYCGAIGVEYMHITNIEERHWIQHRVESVVGDGKFNFSSKEKKRFLRELTAAEGIERYLGAKFPGAKRFSLEGGDALIPMLKEMVRYAGSHGIREVVLGMAHRGRLNVLINVLGKNPQDLFDEFAGKHKEHLGTGDVKYHQGFSSDIETECGLVHLALAFNPSHLEIVSPVVMGSVRARIDRLDKNSSMVLPITLHGDAAISGQGVVQETLNMSKARGYDVGGTVRIVINNQIGFTSSPHNARSSQYCTDIAKMVQTPIFHVNADDLEAVVFVTRVVLDFRNIFKRDVTIDLVCYRRHGHNEADEPSATQPLMYQKIRKHPTLRTIYADLLSVAGVVTLAESTKMVNMFRAALDQGECVVKESRQINMHSFIWQRYLNHDWDEAYSNKMESKRLQELAYRMSKVPASVEMQPRVAKIYHDRAAMARGEKLFDWGSAEILAYATLVDEGIPIRLSGEDTARGTFFHRHAVVHNQKNGTIYIPLAHVHNDQGAFRVWDSVLSEEAVLAFEYGYATAEPRTLVIWEAQFGDFANGAQVVIDQFISSSEQKWGRMCGLVMLLPHGYEGQGPEHSSARLERYLQLCAEQNMQVCIPSTPAQVYHMLRRQALRNMRRPLIVMSPKSLLRHPMAISSLDELANGTFQPTIGEIDDFDAQGVKRVVMCSGKVYYDLLDQRRKNRQQNVAIVRIEQLYPFPLQVLHEVLAPYRHVQDFVWCQEEPQNQGAWYCSQHYFREVISAGASLNYAGRPATASPAVGYLSVHQIQQKILVDDALEVN